MLARVIRDAKARLVMTMVDEAGMSTVEYSIVRLYTNLVTQAESARHLSCDSNGQFGAVSDAAGRARRRGQRNGTDGS